MKQLTFFTAILICCLLAACNGTRQQIPETVITIYTDSVINDVSNHPVGMNLNFIMDGGRFPNPGQTVAEAMKQMGMRYLRYPGGEKSDLYLFSVPPYEKSQPTLARTGGLADYPGVFKDGKILYDPLDFDEYIELCRYAGAEPIVVVAADNYLLDIKKGETLTPREKLLEHAVEWVKYANIKKKYAIKYWMIGNESWNNNNVNSTVDIYAQDVIDFSKAMKAVDPSILIIPNGDSEEFFKTVIEKAGPHIDRLCVSNYGIWDFYAGYNTYRDTVKNLIRPAQIALDAMNKYATPEQLEQWKLIVAEYGTIDWFGHWKGDNDMGHAIVTFDMTGQLLQQPQIEFSCFWNTRWIENETQCTDHDALDKNGNLQATGQALKIWGNHIGKEMVKSTSTDSVRTFSSYDASSGKLYIYLLNVRETAKKVSIHIAGHPGSSIRSAWELFGKNPEDKHPVWQNKETGKNTPDIELKGTSITVIEYKL